MFAFEELEEAYAYFGLQKVRLAKRVPLERTAEGDLETDFRNSTLQHVGRVIIKIA